MWSMLNTSMCFVLFVYLFSHLHVNYCPMLLTCQMHTGYTVSVHDILIFDKYSVVFVRCKDNNQQLDFL